MMMLQTICRNLALMQNAINARQKVSSFIAKTNPASNYQVSLYSTSSKKLYPDHIPLTCLQKTLLGVGSGIGSFLDPYRGDLVANFGEITGSSALANMYEEMLSDAEGLEILNDKPRLNSKSVDYEKLAQLPENTLGYQYSRFYIDNNVSPDTRKAVQFVDDAELAYVMQRYRELHDLVHTLLDLPTTILGELIIKAFEAQQTGLFLCESGAIFGVVQLTNEERVKYLSAYFKARVSASQSRLLMNVYFEKRFEQDIDDLRRELGIVLVDS